MRYLTHAVAAYIGAGLSNGYLLSLSIPAMNWFGVAVYASIWPSFIYCAPVARECKPLELMPMWFQSMMFTF